MHLLFNAFEVPVQNSWVDATFSRESATSIFESSIKKRVYTVQCPLKVVNLCPSRDVVTTSLELMW
ncbi:hypothetical protein Hanom_Chr14g01315611 [Helianthus anomalus]